MQQFPSLKILLASTSNYDQDQQAVAERQKENGLGVTFQYYQEQDSINGNKNDKHLFYNKKRPRTTNACDQCRRKKKACSGGDPCSTCNKKKEICSYTNGVKKHHGDGQQQQQQQQLESQVQKNNINNTKTMVMAPTTNLRPTLQFVYGIPAPPELSSKTDADFPHYFIQEPCINDYGYFGRSAVFSANSNLSTTSSSILNVTWISPSESLCHQGLPSCDQAILLDVYYNHLDTFYPVFSLDYLKQQLYSPPSPSSTSTSLNTLFFCALFVRASYLIRNKTASNNIKYGSISTSLINYAHMVRDTYLDDATPTCSTVLALLMLANHLECNRLRHQLPIAWKWAGEACTLALNMGLYANEPLTMDSTLYQLRLRTFWMAFITDYTIKTIHGRPYTFDEGDICVDETNRRSKHPEHIQCNKNEDIYIQRWLNQLKSTIYFCKSAGRIIKFNYSPQRKLDQHHSYYRGLLSTIDHLVCDAAKKKRTIQNNNDSNKMTDENRQKMKGTTPVVEADSCHDNRLDSLKDFYYFANLMLLHQRYIDDDTSKHGTRPASMEICYYAATSAVRLAEKEMPDELDSLITCPITLYSLVMALHVLRSLFAKDQQDVTMVAQAEIQFEKGYRVLQSLSIFQDKRSMLHDTLCDLWEFYKKHRISKGVGQNRSKLLLKKPIVDNSFANDILHPFSAFLYGISTLDMIQLQQQRQSLSPLSSSASTPASSSSAFASSSSSSLSSSGSVPSSSSSSVIASSPSIVGIASLTELDRQQQQYSTQLWNQMSQQQQQPMIHDSTFTNSDIIRQSRSSLKRDDEYRYLTKVNCFIPSSYTDITSSTASVPSSSPSSCFTEDITISPSAVTKQYSGISTLVLDELELLHTPSDPMITKD
ncbi:uncharacterized protein BX664DRAFT_329466 [Halteromyces radiatus]|uniref:uncharacterized protein n=1 Tax=Halteromyces radiatus TaxID=101107 RepID=UPI002220B50B|nr:uncharacterized protein BX664DRAFT_329466 [Halteromyces radiatus]KAI8093336.1 hypothetical protein BX664DRAFT_329466 [Halteromyces radiatus]